MSFEINPVLAGKFDMPDTASANNIGSSANTDSIPDSRRYTQFDHSVTDAGTATLNFSDFVDMFNPLQHIPIVSSIYRAIAGDDINPVSRVVGDILYGGALGVGSAVLGGVGAVADTELAAETGKDSGGLVLSALFGPDETQSKTQLASAGTTNSAPASSIPPAPAAALAAATNPAATPGQKNIDIAQVAPTAAASAALQIPSDASKAFSGLNVNTHTSDTPSPQLAAAAQAAETASSSNAVSAPASSSTPNAAAPSGTIPLLASTNTSPNAKQPFGGIMAPPHPTDLQAQDMTMALAQGAPSMRLGHTIYTGKLMNGPHPLPPMLSETKGTIPVLTPTYAPPPVLPSSFTSSSAAPMPAPNPYAAMASGGVSQMSSMLMQDMMTKALSQYQSAAAGSSPTSGGRLNFMN